MSENKTVVFPVVVKGMFSDGYSVQSQMFKTYANSKVFNTHEMAQVNRDFCYNNYDETLFFFDLTKLSHGYI